MSVQMCHVVWMPSYAGEPEVRAGGFDYVREEGFGRELFNFMPIRGHCYGYVQTRTGVININRLGATTEETFIDGVTVIWTASHPNGQRVVVGWYQDPRVFRSVQKGRVQGRRVAGLRIGYTCHASAEDCTLVPETQRSFQVPHKGSGLPGQSSLFYPEVSTNTRIAEWLGEVCKYISSWPASPLEHHRGWPTIPDAAHNAVVEAAAIACLIQHFGPPSANRQKDNCGWDLEFAVDGHTLCVEVKGLSGSEVHIELTPNEFNAMERAMNNTFPEGDCRLAIVCESPY
jgi:Domain of unknown function (DUF3883)